MKWDLPTPETGKASARIRPELPPAIAGFIDSAGPSLAPAVVRRAMMDQWYFEARKTKGKA